MWTRTFVFDESIVDQLARDMIAFLREGGVLVGVRRRQSLSPREHDVAGLLIAGYTILNIAARLDIGETTVRTYVQRLYRKLGVVNRAELVRELVASSAVPFEASQVK